MTRPKARLLWIGLGLCLLLGAGVYRTGERIRHHRVHRYDAIYQLGETTYGVPFNLVRAVVWRESRFVPDARGRHGELGLMQLTEVAAQEWADSEQDLDFIHEHVLDPATNVLAGCYYLSKLVKRYGETDNPWVYALADYNAGRANVLRWMEGGAQTNSATFLAQMTFPSTRRYVVSVLQRYEYYETQREETLE